MVVEEVAVAMEVVVTGAETTTETVVEVLVQTEIIMAGTVLVHTDELFM